MVRLTGVPTKWRHFTRSADTPECVEALSQRATALVIVASEKTARDATGTRPLVEYWLWISPTAALVDTYLLFALSDAGEFLVSLGGKIYSAPCESMLCVLSQSGLGYFLALLQLRKLWLLCKHAKQNFCSASCFARCVAFFSLSTVQFKRACWPLHTEHGGNFGFSLVLSLSFALLANTFSFFFTGSSDLSLRINCF